MDIISALPIIGLVAGISSLFVSISAYMSSQRQRRTENDLIKTDILLNSQGAHVDGVKVELEKEGKVHTVEFSMDDIEEKDLVDKLESILKKTSAEYNSSSKSTE